jgi:hypothetical protein
MHNKIVIRETETDPDSDYIYLELLCEKPFIDLVNEYFKSCDPDNLMYLYNNDEKYRKEYDEKMKLLGYKKCQVCNFFIRQDLMSKHYNSKRHIKKSQNIKNTN